MQMIDENVKVVLGATVVVLLLKDSEETGFRRKIRMFWSGMVLIVCGGTWVMVR